MANDLEEKKIMTEHDLVDRLGIEENVSKLGRSLDERDFEALRELFTPDASVTTPGGTATGHDALVEQARARHSRDDGIQHVITNLLVDVDGDQASVRAFLLGEVYRFDLRRTAEGWRFTTLRSNPVWSLNRPAQIQLDARRGGPGASSG